jgi:hypothetical protein
MHYDWFNGLEILQGRWQHGEKVGYCYPSGLEKTLFKWDIYVPLVTKGLIQMFQPLAAGCSKSDRGHVAGESVFLLPPPIAQITVRSVTLCVPLSKADCCRGCRTELPFGILIVVQFFMISKILYNLLEMDLQLFEVILCFCHWYFESL